MTSLEDNYGLLPMEFIDLKQRLNGLISEKSQTADTTFKPTVKSEETMKYFVKKISNCLSIDKDHANVFLIKDGEYLAKLLIRGYKDSEKDEKKFKCDFKKKNIIVLEGLSKTCIQNIECNRNLPYSC